MGGGVNTSKINKVGMPQMWPQMDTTEKRGTNLSQMQICVLGSAEKQI